MDTTKTAVDVVVDTVRVKDASISNEKARTVLGSLGLIKDKGTRLVGHLSGGEKARVALASFVLIPHNILLLDEVRYAACYSIFLDMPGYLGPS